MQPDKQSLFTKVRSWVDTLFAPKTHPIAAIEANLSRVASELSMWKEESRDIELEIREAQYLLSNEGYREGWETDEFLRGTITELVEDLHDLGMLIRETEFNEYHHDAGG